MLINEIKTLPIKKTLPGFTRNMRKNAPHYISSLIEKAYPFIEIASIDNLASDAVDVLTGGNSSVVYRIQLADQQEHYVVKFRNRGASAEAEALQAWQKAGVNTVIVRSYGTVPDVKPTKSPIKYILMDAVLDEHGDPAKTGEAFVLEHPRQIIPVAEAMGTELSKLHRTYTKRSFGEFGDMWGNTAALKSFNAFLMNYVKQHKPTWRDLGFNDEQIDRFETMVKGCSFPKQSVFIHGDFSLRNVLVTSDKPVTICVFDPNPIVGDPTWDLAILHNNALYSAEKHRLRPTSKRYRIEYLRDKNLLVGLYNTYERPPRLESTFDERLKISMLIQTTFLFDIERGKVARQKKDPARNLGLQMRRNVATELFKEVVG